MRDVTGPPVHRNYTASNCEFGNAVPCLTTAAQLGLISGYLGGKDNWLKLGESHAAETMRPHCGPYDRRCFSVETVLWIWENRRRDWM